MNGSNEKKGIGDVGSVNIAAIAARKKEFCWSCPCGFQICKECFEENKWGISNGPTWICPDCERIRMM